MKPTKAKAVELLRQQLEPIAELQGDPRDSEGFDKWWQMTRSMIASVFGQGSPQLENFVAISYSLSAWTSGTPQRYWDEARARGLQRAAAQLEALATEVYEFWPDEAELGVTTPAAHIELLFERFHAVTRQLRSRRGKRATLRVSDEYDVQDLLHALLRLFFDDVRAEEWTPSYAGGASRMDFILNKEGIVIEVKKTRDEMTAKDLGDQLLIDIMRYKAHPGSKSLFCFIYDPDGFLPNPAGVERDLSRTSDGMAVRCFIRPR